MPWSLHMHMRITCIHTHRHSTHRATYAGAPIRSQTHLHLFRSNRDPLLMGSLQSLCPPTEAIPCFPYMPYNSAMISHTLPSSWLFHLILQVFLLSPGLTPCSHPASSPNHCSGYLLHSLRDFLQQCPASVLLLPFLLSFTSQLPAFYSHPAPQPVQQVVSFSQEVGQFMTPPNTHRQKWGITLNHSSLHLTYQINVFRSLCFVSSTKGCGVWGMSNAEGGWC